MKNLIFLLAFLVGTISIAAQTLKANNSMYNRVISQTFAPSANSYEIGTSFTLLKGKGWKIKIAKAENKTAKYDQPFTARELKRDLSITTNRK